MPSNKAVVSRRIIWLVLIALYLMVSGPRLLQALRAETVEAPSAFHSTDKYLRSIAGMSEGSRRMNEAFALLPDKGKPVAIVWTEEPVSSLIGMVAAYLVWPRPVNFLSPRALIDPGFDARSYSGFLFCDVNTPPWASRRIPLSRNVFLVPEPSPGEAEAR